MRSELPPAQRHPLLYDEGAEIHWPESATFIAWSCLVIYFLLQEMYLAVLVSIPLWGISMVAVEVILGNVNADRRHRQYEAWRAEQKKLEWYLRDADFDEP